MMPFYLIIIMSAFFLGTAYLSRILLRNQPIHSRQELENLYPECKSLGENRKALFVLIALIGLFYVVVATERFDKTDIRGLFFGFSMGSVILLLDGLYSSSTNIFSMSNRYRRDQFFYDENKEFKWVANLQIGLSLLGMIINLLLLWLYPR